MDLRETALIEASGTLGYEITADTLEFAGVDSSLGRSSFDSEFEDEDSDESEIHIVDDDSTVGHDA